jgi:GT2 family glycosyltransferase
VLVSVVVCTHSTNNYQNLMEAVDSLLEQTHREMEIIIVVDGNEELYERIVTAYGAHDNIKIVITEESLGCSGARNVGVKTARGDVIAFTDDDAIAERRWVASLVDTYEKLDAISVGGKILPIWAPGKPDYFPEELYWLVGVSHEEFAEVKAVEVRNTFGPNMSFRRKVFKEIGLFNEKLAFAERGTSYMQGEEPEFALRMKQKLGRGVMYNPEAIVYHKIPPSKVKVKMLLRRAFYQGYSKALLRKLHPSADSMVTERSYLKTLLLKYIPQRMKRVYCLPELKKLSLLVAVIISVGLGFVYGYAKGT